MEPIHMNEIPSEIKEYVGHIYSIRFPRQGYTSNVGIIETANGIYALKRTKGEFFCSWEGGWNGTVIRKNENESSY